MFTEALPVEKFVSLNINNPIINAVISGWNIEQDLIEEVLVKNFIEMGIFVVHPVQTKVLIQASVRILHSSEEIAAALRKARIAAAGRAGRDRGFD